MKILNKLKNFMFEEKNLSPKDDDLSIPTIPTYTTTTLPPEENDDEEETQSYYKEQQKKVDLIDKIREVIAYKKYLISIHYIDDKEIHHIIDTNNFPISDLQKCLDRFRDFVFKEETIPEKKTKKED